MESKKRTIEKSAVRCASEIAVTSNIINTMKDMIGNKIQRCREKIFLKASVDMDIT